tara:strand:+ start:294 stop:1205 length:912 start_codon:yes stop_codon:yes gene_type:complete
MKITRRELRQIIVNESIGGSDTGDLTVTQAMDLVPSDSSQSSNTEYESSIEKSLKMMFTVVKPKVFEVMAGIDAEALREIIKITSQKLESLGLSDAGRISKVMTLLPAAISDGSISRAYSLGGVVKVVELIVSEIKKEDSSSEIKEKIKERKKMKVTHNRLLKIIKEELAYVLEEGPTQEDYDKRYNVRWDLVKEQMKQAMLYNTTILEFLKLYHGPGSKTQTVDVNGQLVMSAPIDWKEAMAKSGIQDDATVDSVIKNYPEVGKLLDFDRIVDDMLEKRMQQHAAKWQTNSLAKKDDIGNQP